MRFSRTVPTVLTLLAATPLLLLAVAGDAAAQTLRGSRGAVDRTYRQAVAHDLTFYRSGSSVRNAASQGKLVRLGGNADYRVAGADYPYALPITRTFVQRLARQYRAECGEKLVVTSALRPTSMRLSNGSDKSVHPAGMAVDLRKPTRARCLRWLRETLLAVERAGVIDATEERRPPHFHVAVYPNPYRRYVASRGGDVPDTGRRTASAARRSSSGSSSRSTYRVRSGDTLWTIARRHRVSVDDLKVANDIRSSRIVAGQVLVIPAR